MPVSDIGNIPIGFVSRVLSDSFEVQLLNGEHIRLSEDVLFSVDHVRATVICRGGQVDRYVQE